MTEPITLTGVLAAYGAAISSFALGWNVFRDLLDKPKLKVSTRFGRVAKNEVTGQLYSVKPDLPVHGASEQVFIFVDVTNVGRRPIRWDGWGGKHYKNVGRKESFVILPLGLPKMLNEGESHTEMTPELYPDIDNVRQLYIWDASGKDWYVSKRDLRKLKEAVHKQMTVRDSAVKVQPP